MTLSIGRNSTGFTLIEVMVALLIVASVLTSTYTAIVGFAEQRQRIKERFNAQSIAWNRLMRHYIYTNGWQREFNETGTVTTGTVEENGFEWSWQYSQQAALGRGVTKQTVDVYNKTTNPSLAKPVSASLVLFTTRSSKRLVQEGDAQ